MPTFTQPSTENKAPTTSTTARIVMTKWQQYWELQSSLFYMYEMQMFWDKVQENIAHCDKLFEVQQQHQQHCRQQYECDNNS